MYLFIYKFKYFLNHNVTVDTSHFKCDTVKCELLLSHHGQCLEGLQEPIMTLKVGISG